jgi:hypothetical protein
VLDGIASALKMSSDALYEQAGMPVPGDEDELVSGVLEAIDADPLLTSRQRTALREIYQSFVEASPRARRASR